ncbi:Flp family type IVb pilin [Arthrobacter bussei]|uniref:Flp family type IVb pilin n=1 Tax=Arthrobacter bussei TaxID=2594179 RepID=A0A7X1TMM3_9MICC|nr:Flp family type IVb pilin [Arthrobacter bussei]MPY09807.1 Flp family type IVb pilin [Arthrobacter bussei]
MFDHVAASFATFVAAARHRLSSEQTGATAVEYALMVGLIAVVLIAGVTLFGGQLNTFFNGLGTKLNIVPAAPAAPAAG